MIFCSDRPEKTGPQIESKLRKELKHSAPLVYELEVLGTVQPTSIGRFLDDLAGGASLLVLSSSGLRPVYTLRFMVPDRDGEIRVAVLTDGEMTMLGGILYSQVLARRVRGPVQLREDEVVLRAFDGEPSVVAKLNGDPALVQRVNDFARVRYRLGQRTIASRRFFSLAPFESGSLLSVGTMPRRRWWGRATSFGVGEFQDIARAVEAVL